MTIAELVTLTGISKSSVLRYLNGERDINLNTVATFARAYGVSPLSILVAAESMFGEEQARDARTDAPTSGTKDTTSVPSRPAHAPARSRARGARGTTEQHKP